MGNAKIDHSRFLTVITITDPADGSTHTVELRRLNSGAVVGLDGSYLEQLEGSEHPFSPYDSDAIINVPDDESPDFGHAEVSVPARPPADQTLYPIEEGEFCNPTSADEVMDQACTLMDRACTWDICGTNLFIDKAGELFTVTVTAELAKAYPDFANDVIEQSVDSLREEIESGRYVYWRDPDAGKRSGWRQVTLVDEDEDVVYCDGTAIFFHEIIACTEEDPNAS